MITQPTRAMPALRPHWDRMSLVALASELSGTEVEYARTESAPEEALQTDARASLTPSQMVEKKLVTLLRGSALPVSHAQMLYTSMCQR